MPGSSHKLKTDQQDILLNLLAACQTTSYIQEYCKEHFQVELTSQALSYYRHKYRDEIEQRKINLLRSIPIADRAYRQAIRQMLIVDIIERDRLWRKEYDKDGNIILKGNHAVINQILDSAGKDQDDFIDSGDSTMIQFKAMLQLSGEAALKYLRTGRLPSLEEIRGLQVSQDQRTREGEG